MINRILRLKMRALQILLQSIKTLAEKGLGRSN